MTKGKLYIVATPIGNLSDITLRAIEVIKEVDLILSEDTRETEKLLNHFNMSKSQISYRDQNHVKVYPKIKELIESGKNLALVSDSGTPLISDPGFKLVTQLLQDNIDVESIPGPSAAITALTISGLPTDKFTFLGFLPKSSGQKEKIIKKYGELDTTLIIYESPYRVSKLLKEIHTYLGDRKVCVCSEMTKIHEKVVRGSISEISKLFENKNIKGEYVILVAKEGY